MIYPSPDKLDGLGSKYALVITAAKRARQIKDGARRLADSKSANPLTVALEEVAKGEIVPQMVGDPEAELAAAAAAAELVTALGGEIVVDSQSAALGTLLSVGDELEDYVDLDDDTEGVAGLLSDDDETPIPLDEEVLMGGIAADPDALEEPEEE
jgi:DNA-directed RNA polymerase subunit omega